MRRALALTVLLTLSTGLPAQDPPATVDFSRDVRPIFARSCVSCHGPEKRKSNYRLDLRAAALGEGSIGRPILAGHGADSPLVRYVAGSDPDIKMPPKGSRLSDVEVNLLRAWIDQGAVWPDEEAGKDRLAEAHWSYRPILRPEPPAIPGASGAIDRFLLAKLQKEGLGFSPEAGRRTLIRRLYFHVTGLPPAPEDIAAFETDPSPDAYGRLVERVLN